MISRIEILTYISKCDIIVNKRTIWRYCKFMNKEEIMFHLGIDRFINRFYDDQMEKLFYEKQGEPYAEQCVWANYVNGSAAYYLAGPTKDYKDWWITGDWTYEDHIKYESFFLIQHKDKFYPFYNQRRSASSKESHHPFSGAFCSSTGSDLYNFTETLDKLEKKVLDYQGKGHGTFFFEPGSEYTAKSCVGTKSVSYGTGNYVVSHSYPGLSDSYTVREQMGTRKEKVYREVTRSKPDKKEVSLICWFEPLNKKEKDSFLKVIKNQQKVVELMQEYASLNIFQISRKKEIVREVINLINYTYLVIAKACVDRFNKKETFENSIQETKNEIKGFEKEIESLQAEAKAIPLFTPYKSMSQCKGEKDSIKKKIEDKKRWISRKKEDLKKKEISYTMMMQSVSILETKLSMYK